MLNYATKNKYLKLRISDRQFAKIDDDSESSAIFQEKISFFDFMKNKL